MFLGPFWGEPSQIKQKFDRTSKIVFKPPTTNHHTNIKQTRQSTKPPRKVSVFKLITVMLHLSSICTILILYHLLFNKDKARQFIWILTLLKR